MYVCSEPGCPELVEKSGPCRAHAQAAQRRADERRPSSARRGYGATHQRIRARWAPQVAAGGVKCARCDEMIIPGELWDLGHDDNDRSRYTGPEHARCNRATKSHTA